MANGKKPKNVGSRLAIILIIKKWESTKNPPPIGGGGGFERNLCYMFGILLKQKKKVNPHQKSLIFIF